MTNLIKDILTEGKENRYSQGRVYLFVSIIAYYVTLGVLLFHGMDKKTQVDLTSFDVIIEALKYAMALFGGYVFGGKFLNVATTIGNNFIGNKKTNNKNKEILND